MGGGTTGRAGDVVTPSESSRDWQNAKVLIAKDGEGNYRLVGVDEAGRVLTDAELTVGDIEIGAVELKDHNSEVRADILAAAAAGGMNSLAVTSGTLATQATLAAVLAGLGPLGTEATLAGVLAALGPLATQATLAAVQTLITNYRAAIGAAAPSDVVQVGGQVKTGVPTAEANDELVPLLVTAYRELILAGYNRAQSSLDASIVSQAKIPPIIETGWAALAAAGDETSHRDVRIYKNHTVSYDITIGALTSMDLRVWALIEDSIPFMLADFNVLAAGQLVDALKWSGMQITEIWGELQAENGDTDGSVVMQYSGGN